MYKRQLQKDFIELIAKDAVAFEPLSKAYGLPKDTEEQRAEKERIMEEALDVACGVPMEIMEKCCEAIEPVSYTHLGPRRLSFRPSTCCWSLPGLISLW